MNKIFKKFELKDLKLKNRIVMPPMCMYSSDEKGFVKEWHKTHYSTRAVGGVGLIIVEATSVDPRGRISDRDLGIWNDEQIEGLKGLVDLVHSFGSKIGIQLGHSGRKSTVDYLESLAPSAIAFSEKLKIPKEMTEEDIEEAIIKFKDGARRALEAGFDLIEIHGAHGYLINQFLSPLTNKRTDKYGGTKENRVRFLKKILEEVRKVWIIDKPLQLRISAFEYAEGGNKAEDLADMINMIKEYGIDIINVSSGGVVLCDMDVFPGYQIKLAETVKERTGLPVIAGGLVSSVLMVEEILKNKRADLVFLGRELLRNPYWIYKAAEELGYDLEWPEQYERAKK
jgi:NADPH2 dehydrogenase